MECRANLKLGRAARQPLASLRQRPLNAGPLSQQLGVGAQCGRWQEHTGGGGGREQLLQNVHAEQRSKVRKVGRP